LVAAQVQDFGPAHATATTEFLAASTAEGGNEYGGSASEFFDFTDSGSSVEWTEESSEEDLDYFAALDRTRQTCQVLAPGADGDGRLQSVELVRRKGLGFV
jgi:hypothetical protein